MSTPADAGGAFVPSAPPPPPAPLEPLPPPIVIDAPAPPVPRVCPAPLGAARDRTFGAITVAPAGDDPHLARLGATLFSATLAHNTDAPVSVAFTSSVNNAATWSSPQRLDDPADCVNLTTGCPLDPQLLAASSELYALYAGDEIGVRVRASHDRGASFTASTIALGGSVAGATTSADGHLHVAAVRGGPLGAYGSANHVLEYAVSADHGAHFSRPVVVSGREEMLPLIGAHPAVVTDSARNFIYVVYVRGGRDLAWDVVVAVSKDHGATWRRSAVAAGGTPPSAACALRLSPAATIDPATGALHVVWFDSRGGGRLAHAICTAGAARCTEGAAISDAPIPLGIDPASPPPIASLTIDSKRRTLRAVWTQPDASSPAGAPQLLQATAPLATGRR